MSRAEELIDAVEFGDLEQLARLLGAGLSPDTCNDQGESALSLAAELGEHAVVDMLLERGATKQVHALYLAASEGHAQTVEVFMHHGVGFGQDRGARSRLLSKIVSSQHAEVLRILLAVPFDLEVGGMEETAVGAAAIENCLDMIDVFIECGVEVHEDASLVTKAVEFGHLGMVEKLLALGCPPTGLNAIDRSAIEIAREAGDTGMVATLTRGPVAPASAVEIVHSRAALERLEGRLHDASIVEMRTRGFFGSLRFCADIRSVGGSLLRVVAEDVTELGFYHSADHEFYVIDRVKLEFADDLYYLCFDPDESSRGRCDSDQDFVRCGSLTVVCFAG